MVLTKRERTSFKRDAQGRVTQIKYYSNSKTPVSDSLVSQIKTEGIKKKLRKMREASKRMENWTLYGR